MEHEHEDQEEGRDESMGSVTDESVSIETNTLRTYDSDTSSVATRGSSTRRDNSSQSTNPPVKKKGARSPTTKGNRKDKTARRNNVSMDPACCSREDTSHLIKLRDEMISAKHQEVLLLSQQNKGLREGIYAVETEMATLYGVIQTKDDAIQRLKREGDRLRRDIKRLQVEGEERKGEENAMVVAATQNTRLLKLLEQEELKREDVLSERNKALAEVNELKHRVRVSDERHAERTAGLEVKLIKYIGENADLRQKYSSMEERTKTLENSLECTIKEAVFEKDTIKEELHSRRRSYYKVLGQLQEARDELQLTKDQMETRGQELEACRQQGAELEMRLGTVQSDVSTMLRNSTENEVKVEEDATMAAARLSKEVSLSERLQDKVASMSRTILRLVERHKNLQTEVERYKDGETRLRAQIEQARELQLRLEQKVMRAESRLNLELTYKRLHGAIDTFNSQMRKPLAPATCVKTEAWDGEGLPEEECRSRMLGRGDALWSKRQLLSKYTTFFRLSAGRDAHALDLDVSDCGLEDSDVDVVAETVRSCPSVLSLNLSMNLIGDAGAASIAGALSQPSCVLRKVDLRCNQMTMEGVRILANALEENTSRGVSHVYVHNEGRIDALGRQNKGPREGLEESPVSSFVSLAVVDVRDNKPLDTVKPKTTVLPAASRSKKQFASKPGRRGSSAMIALQRDTRNTMAKSVYLQVAPLMEPVKSPHVV